MALKATSSGETRELIPPRNYLGIISGVFDIGTQDGGQYGPKHQIVIMWELHGRKEAVRDKEGNVLTISKFYSLSFDPKSNLRFDVESMLNAKFNEDQAKEGYPVEDLIGLACRIQVEKGTRTDGTPKNMVGSLMALDDDDEAPQPATNHCYFEIRKPNDYIPSDVPEWIAKMIRKSPEWTGHAQSARAGQTSQARPGPGSSSGRAERAAAAAAGNDDDDIPF